jgi:type II secretory pathway pseudopilin PulG
MPDAAPSRQILPGISQIRHSRFSQAVQYEATPQIRRDLQAHFSGECLERNPDGECRSNDQMTNPATEKRRIAPAFGRRGDLRRGRQMPRISSCSGSRVGCGLLTSDVRPLASAERGPESVRGFTLPKLRERVSAFTLLELLIVVGIIALLMVLIAPAFTTIKSAGDVTSAAYTIKGVLDTARTYAKANNTYTWVGFYEEDGSIPSVTPAPNPSCPGCVGRLVMSIVASKDGTDVYGSLRGATIDATRLTQVGKLIKIDNIHLPLFTLGTGTGSTFDARPSPSPASEANFSRFGELNVSPPNTAPLTTPFNLQYPVGDPAPTPQYTFSKLLQFSPRGESSVLGDGAIRRIVEIGLIQTHGNVAPTPTPSAGKYVGNVVAVQINGFAGDVKIYRR